MLFGFYKSAAEPMSDPPKTALLLKDPTCTNGISKSLSNVGAKYNMQGTVLAVKLFISAKRNNH